MYNKTLNKPSKYKRFGAAKKVRGRIGVVTKPGISPQTPKTKKL
jgi:hypothetical protein